MVWKPVYYIFVALLVVFPAAAQERKLSIKEGTTVVIKFTPEFLNFQRVSANTGRTSYVATVKRGVDGKISVNGRIDWQDAGWAFMTEFVLAKIDKQRDYVEVEMRGQSVNQKIHFDNSVGNLDTAFQEVVFVGSMSQFTASDYYKTEVVDRLLSKTFTGNLAKIPRDRQLEMVESLGYVPGAITGESFQNKFYISFALLAPYYNTGIYHPTSARAAKLKELIESTRTSYLLNDYPDIQGIKWVIKLSYGLEYEISGYKESANEWMQAYIPFDLVRKYQAGTISEQAMVNKFRVLVNNAPVKLTIPATTGFPYFKGPKGGCYKINPSGNKSYVDASLCG